MKITCTREDNQRLREWEYLMEMLDEETEETECEPDDDCTKKKCARCKRGRI